MIDTEHRAYFVKHETARFYVDATARFEELALQKNKEGFRLDKWVVDVDGIFHLVWTALKEVRVSEGQDVVAGSFQLAPWQIFIMRHAKRMVLADGRDFSIVRLPAEYRGMDADDPVVITDINGCTLMAECTLISLKRVKIGALTVDDLLCLGASMDAFSKKKVVKFLRAHYQNDTIDEDTVVFIIHLHVEKGTGPMSLLDRYRLMRKRLMVKLMNGGN